MREGQKLLTLDAYKYMMNHIRNNASLPGGDVDPERTSVKTFTEGARSIDVVVGENECRSLLEHKGFHQHDFATTLKKRLPSDHPPSCIGSEFLERNPISLNGEPHRAARREFLKSYNTVRKDVIPKIRPVAAKSFQMLTHRDDRASIDHAVAYYVDSIAQHLISHFADTVADASLWSSSSACIFEIFSSNVSLRKKEGQVRKLLEVANATAASECLETSVMLSFLLQGRDPIFGALCAFLRRMSCADDVKREEMLDDAYGQNLFHQSTPVKYVGRVASRNIVFAGTKFTEGDEVYVMLPEQGILRRNRGMAFGIGAHVCAGQALSIDIGNCWLEELQRVHREMDWSQLPTIKPIPSVFLKFEEVSTTDVEH